MDSKTRFTTFGIGALVGVLVLWGMNQKADPARERRRQVMASLSLPGMYYDHAVQGIPTLLLFRGGKLVGRQVGAVPKATLSAWIDAN